MSELDLNLRGLLFKELSSLYPSLTYGKVDNAVRNLSVPEYKHLLALKYQKKNAELDLELAKLNILSL